jgi:hypothetical protein
MHVGNPTKSSSPVKLNILARRDARRMFSSAG